MVPLKLEATRLRAAHFKFCPSPRSTPNSIRRLGPSGKGRSSVRSNEFRPRRSSRSTDCVEYLESLIACRTLARPENAFDPLRNVDLPSRLSAIKQPLTNFWKRSLIWLDRHALHPRPHPNRTGFSGPREPLLGRCKNSVLPDDDIQIDAAAWTQAGELAARQVV